MEPRRKVSKKKMASDARWLLSPRSEGGAGFTMRQLGSYLGRSPAWVHHLVMPNGNGRISPTAEQEKWLRLLCRVERERATLDADIEQDIESIQKNIGWIIGQVDKLSRRKR